MVLMFFMGAVTILGISAVLLRHRHPLNWLLYSHPLAYRRHRYRHDRILCHQTKTCLHYLYKEARLLNRSPKSAENILRRLQSLLLPSSIFKKQRRRLHCLVQHIRKGHQIYWQNKSLLRNTARRQRNISNMTTDLNQLIDINGRLEQLDLAAAEQEIRTEYLIQLARNYTAAHHYTKLLACINAARKIQYFKRKLLRGIHRTENQLLVIDRKITIHTITAEKDERNWLRNIQPC